MLYLLEIYFDIIYLTAEVFNMEKQTIIKGKCLKVAKAQKKKMIVPDIMLRTENVLIPVVEPVPIKQTFNTPLTENKPQILRSQKYINSPALRFSETPLHILYNHLENLLEVNYNTILKSFIFLFLINL